MKRRDKTSELNQTKTKNRQNRNDNVYTTITTK